MQNSFVVVAPSLGKLTLNCYFHRSRHLHQVGCHIKFPPLLYSLLILRANCYCAKFKFNLILVTWLCGVPLWKELREVLQKLFVIKPSLFFRGFSRRGDDNNRVIKWLSHESSKKTLFTFTWGLVGYQLMLLLIRAVLDQVGCGICVAEQDLTSYWIIY